jgi:hypothetical protein
MDHLTVSTWVVNAASKGGGHVVTRRWGSGIMRGWAARL